MKLKRKHSLVPNVDMLKFYGSKEFQPNYQHEFPVSFHAAMESYEEHYAKEHDHPIYSKIAAIKHVNKYLMLKKLNISPNDDYELKYPKEFATTLRKNMVQNHLLRVGKDGKLTSKYGLTTRESNDLFEKIWKKTNDEVKRVHSSDVDSDRRNDSNRNKPSTQAD